MYNDHMPRFDNHASCSDHDPDLWFPQEKPGNRSWSRTPEAMKAREICSNCPALQECLDYSLKYTGLYGIWAGLDWYERADIQKWAESIPVLMTNTIPHYFREGVTRDE